VALRRARVAGLVVFGLQLVGFGAWSSVLADRFALTKDFGVYEQAAFLIGHGDLDPYSSLHATVYWRDAAAFLLWPIALVTRVWPHPVTLLWTQDVAIVAAEVVAFAWMCDVVAGAHARGRRRVPPALLAGAGCLLLVVNPWTVWTASFDFHLEPFSALLCLLAARDLARDRRRAWVWSALALASGVVGASYVVGLGISALLAGRHWWRRGGCLVLLGGAWTLGVDLLHADVGTANGAYGYLLGARAPGAGAGLAALLVALVTRPWRAVAALVRQRVDIVANVSPPGILGIASPWTLGVPGVVLLENGLRNNNQFIVPSFQSFPVYVFVAVGSVIVWAAWASSGRPWVRILSMAAVVLATVNAIGWSVVWTPRTAAHWLTVSPQAARVLSRVEQRIPTGAEVVVSQGISGGFARRRWVFAQKGNESIPIETRPVWVIVAPTQGTELESVPGARATIGELAGPLHATLVSHGAGIWAFRWMPPPHMTALRFVTAATPAVPAWTDVGASGTAVLRGPASEWHVTATGLTGYIVRGTAWLVAPGRYSAVVRLSCTGPVDVEVWDTTTATLLGRAVVGPTSGIARVTGGAVVLGHVTATAPFGGVGPFTISPIPAAYGDQLEVRVWTPGHTTANVYSLQLTAAPRS